MAASIIARQCRDEFPEKNKQTVSEGGNSGPAAPAPAMPAAPAPEPAEPAKQKTDIDSILDGFKFADDPKR